MTLDISRSAAAALDSMPAKHYKQVVQRIHELLRNQSPHDARSLSGQRGYKRIDQGEYRIIYYVERDVVRVPVVGKRNDDEVYKRLERAQ